MQERERHWEHVWTTRDPTAVTWYQPSLQRSLALIDGLSLQPEGPVIDIGGGASTFVDDMLARHFQDVSVLDVSATALRTARQRLGAAGAGVHWLHADVTTAKLPASRYQLWHDRAVFHFLTEAADRAAYTTLLCSALRADGHAVIATFGPAGPQRCSGLPAVRYSADELLAALGPRLQLLAAETEEHMAASGVRQQFLYAVLRLAP